MSAPIRAGIIGGAGYTGGELLRLLLIHPAVEIAFVQSSSHAGAPVASVHEGLWGDTELTFSADAPLQQADVVFLCSGHGFSEKYWAEHSRPESLRVIDLAQDFRDEHDGYVYGLPEANRRRIAESHLVANPGCYATAIQLALLPLARHGLLAGREVQIAGITGSTGAGVKPGFSTHFSWRDNNLSTYKVFTHQHLLEISRTLRAAGWEQPQINFVPMRGDFPRGIYINAWLHTDATPEQIEQIYADDYAAEPFTHYVAAPLDMKQAVNTNKALVHTQMHGDMLLVTSAIDNLLKGASGQAVQNMNIMFGLPETTGLRLKPQAF